MDFSSFLESKLEGQRKYREQPQGWDVGRLSGAYKQPRCVQSAQFSWQEACSAAVGRCTAAPRLQLFSRKQHSPQSAVFTPQGPPWMLLTIHPGDLWEGICASSGTWWTFNPMSCLDFSIKFLPVHFKSFAMCSPVRMKWFGLPFPWDAVLLKLGDNCST